MRSSRQVAVLTRQLTRVVWSSRSPSTPLPATGVSTSSVCPSSSVVSTNPPPPLPLLRPGYLTQSQGMATSTSSSHPAGSESQEQSSGESGRDHSGPSEEAKRRARNFQIATGSACAFFGASYLLYRQLTVRAAEATVIEKVCVCVCVCVC